jgi:hypothetical protein
MEFIAWLELVNELADRVLREVEVTDATYNMLISEWVRLRNYSWFNGPYKAQLGVENGTLLFTTAWGKVLIRCAKDNNDRF